MVTVRLFARLKDLAKRETLTLSVNQPVSLKQFIETLSPSLPELMPLVKAKRVLIAVNQEVATEETVIRDGDEIALMPPFSGGNSQLTPPQADHNSQLSPKPWIRIQTEDFSVDDEIARVKAASTRIGGIVVFLGTARDFSRGHAVKKLTYEHYAGMAEEKVAQIRQDAKDRFDIIEAAIIHRTGEIPLGGNIVLIVVGAEHRAEAFRACQWCIDRLKAITPIWKKEVTPKGEVWVEEHP